MSMFQFLADSGAEASQLLTVLLAGCVADRLGLRYELVPTTEYESGYTVGFLEIRSVAEVRGL